ncbi:MAG TPA: NADH-quinone oxidoreductase subunit C [Candidatus Eisenbacteria bacterium]|nr:NADH-quinone oxidoreductase subunit C [Candidatus Eisenbacteria bacterium]
MNAQEHIRRIGARPGESREGLAAAHVPPELLAGACAELAGGGLPLSLFFATDDRGTDGTFGLHAVFALDEEHGWLMLSSALPKDAPRYPAVTARVIAAHWYERYAMDMFGIIAEGHPDARRLVHHENVPEGTHPLRKDFAWNAKLDHADVPYPMHHVKGEGVYEIPVGPIHAGVIEPGHFRFNVAGERIITLEGKLFFTHKGVEKLLEGKTPEEALPFIERLSGDMSASNALAFCQAVETIAGCKVPERAAALRSLLCELERMTMHIHDLANIAGNGTGYTVMGAHGFRIKERLVRLSARLLGNRFWRGAIVPGGMAENIGPDALADAAKTAKDAHREMRALLDMCLSSDGERERLETTGLLSKQGALAFGALGVPARASGIGRDTRITHPYAAYAEHQPALVTETAGDVHARFMVRVRELDESARLVAGLAAAAPAGPVRAACQAKDGFALGAVESWRGELLCALRLKDGRIDRCVPRDPSFCNWPLFGEIGPGNIVPDFPLCNKSLNLSYSGTDM